MKPKNWKRIQKSETEIDFQKPSYLRFAESLDSFKIVQRPSDRPTDRPTAELRLPSCSWLSVRPSPGRRSVGRSIPGCYLLISLPRLSVGRSIPSLPPQAISRSVGRSLASCLLSADLPPHAVSRSVAGQYLPLILLPRLSVGRSIPGASSLQPCYLLISLPRLSVGRSISSPPGCRSVCRSVDAWPPAGYLLSPDLPSQAVGRSVAPSNSWTNFRPRYRQYPSSALLPGCWSVGRSLPPNIRHVPSSPPGCQSVSRSVDAYICLTSANVSDLSDRPTKAERFTPCLQKYTSWHALFSVTRWPIPTTLSRF